MMLLSKVWLLSVRTSDLRDTFGGVNHNFGFMEDRHGGPDPIMEHHSHSELREFWTAHQVIASAGQLFLCHEHSI
jgi:hypothetical protein